MVIAIAALSLFRRGTQQQAVVAPSEGNDDPQSEGANVGRARRRRNLGSRIALAQRRTREAAPEDEDDGGDGDERGEGGEEEENDISQLVGKVGTKKLRKLQEKADKKAMREQEEAMREDKKKREALKEEERQQEEERKKLEEEKKEEELKRQKEEQERREHEEYLKLKESFVIEEMGEAQQENESENLLQEFIDYIKRTKVVFLEDLASQFNLRTQDAISRVNSLQESGQLTGVVDDRGKFIYISKEELDSVAKFIKQRGRVSIAELVSSSNTLINLQPEAIAAH